MMRFVFMFFLVLLCPWNLWAQDSPMVIGKSSFCCVYQHTTCTKDLADSTVVDAAMTILEVGDQFAKYGDLSAYAGTKPDGVHTGGMDGDPRVNDNVMVLQHYPDPGTFTIREALLPNFYVYDEQIALDWELLTDESEVLGYTCQKARTTYGGRIWNVWYTGEIPSMNGPWKLTGLPGLVLKAESEDGTHVFEAKALFQVGGQAISYEPKRSDVKVKRNKFITLRNQLKTDARWPKNALYYLSQGDYKSVTLIKANNQSGVVPRAIVNGLALPLNFAWGHIFQPLEFQ